MISLHLSCQAATVTQFCDFVKERNLQSTGAERISLSVASLPNYRCQVAILSGILNLRLLRSH
jgi:hypothetical protein